MKKISLAFSPCPNDTFIFHGMVNNKIDPLDYTFNTAFLDIDTLNTEAMKETYDVTKVSFFAYLYLKDKYTLLSSGSALGFGCGPLLISKHPIKNITEAVIAVPGMYTTAHLLLKLWNPSIKNVTITRYDLIMEGIKNGEFDAGVIIHEGRFVYKQFDLEKIIDLGEWWEKETSLPIPLGCIVIHNRIKSSKDDINDLIKKSISFAQENENDTLPFIKKYAQEMDTKVIQEHIDLYVNNFTYNLGEKGREAIAKLEEMAEWKKILE